MGDCHVRFCEGLGVKFVPRPTRLFRFQPHGSQNSNDLRTIDAIFILFLAVLIDLVVIWFAFLLVGGDATVIKPLSFFEQIVKESWVWITAAGGTIILPMLGARLGKVYLSWALGIALSLLVVTGVLAVVLNNFRNDPDDPVDLPEEPDCATLVVEAEESYGMGFMRYDPVSKMVVSANNGPVGPENVTFKVDPKCTSDYQLDFEIASQNAHSVHLYQDINDQSDPIYQFTSVATGGYSPDFAQWFPVINLTLSNQKSTLLTFHAPRGTNERIPSIRAIKLTPVNFTYSADSKGTDIVPPSPYTVYLYSPEGQTRALNTILRLLGSEVSKQGYNVTSSELRASDFPFEAALNSITVGYHTEGVNEGKKIRALLEDILEGDTDINFHDFMYSPVSPEHIVVYVNLQPLDTIEECKLTTDSIITQRFNKDFPGGINGDGNDGLDIKPELGLTKWPYPREGEFSGRVVGIEVLRGFSNPGDFIYAGVEKHPQNEKKVMFVAHLKENFTREAFEVQVSVEIENCP